MLKIFKLRIDSIICSKYKSVTTLLILMFTLFLSHQYFVSGLYKWHIAQIGNQISVIYVLSVIVGTSLLDSRRVKLLISISIILLYTIFTGITGALLIVIYYVVGFYLLGIKYHKDGLALQMSYGLIFFLLLRSVLSIISNQLILNEVVFVGVIAVVCRVVISSREKFSHIIAKNKVGISNESINIIVVVISLVTVGLNIAASQYDHDSLWYPLRSNALYFFNGFFADNGFYGQVHLYPKLWESLTNNIFIENNFSYGTSLGASLYIVIAVITYSLFSKNKLINTLIVLTTPVIVGLSFSLKTDLLLLTVFLVAFIGVEKHRYDIVISAFLLLLCIKNSSFLLVLAIPAYVYLKNKHDVSPNKVRNCNYLIVTLAFMVSSLFLLRTYLLTGVFVASPNSIINIQEMLGFHYELPKRSVPKNTHDGIFDIYKMIIFPEELGTHRFFYNGYLWAASVFVLDIFTVILLLIVMVIIYSVPYLGDGNYYVVLTTLLTVLFLRKVKIEKVGYIIILLNVVISVVANPNWVVPKVPSVNNVCNTIICSDDNYLFNVASYHKISELINVINDKSKKYFVISKHDSVSVWMIFHRYNVAHIKEFDIWNNIVPLYSLKEYLVKHIDVVIVENDYNFKDVPSGFKKFKADDKYSYYEKNL